LRRLGDLIGEHAERLARLEVNDSGKLYRELLGQLRGLGGWYHYYAGLADKVEGRQIPAPNPGYLGYTRREPVGVVAAITPWNSPLLLLAWKLAPALAAGCTVVVKPSEHSPVSTLGFAELITEAGFPPGVVNVVTGLSRETGAALARHPGVERRRRRGVCRDRPGRREGGRGEPERGDAGAGRQVAPGAFPDADLAAAANGVVAGVFAATGQTCMAGSRLIVHADVHDELVRLVAERARAIRLGEAVARDGVGQRLPGGGAVGAVRRGQGFGPGPRERRARDRRVPDGEGGVGRADRWHAGPVHAGLKTPLITEGFPLPI
jgi:acyl-CoA reductase-like NAD-dependent aldehyde dehydrogenase